MASVMAIESKAVFEKLLKDHGVAAAVGGVLPLDHYGSAHKALAPLAAGGALFLVTVRPPDEALWLVAILEAPRAGKAGWSAAPSAIAMTDISKLKGTLTFATGSGITAKPGALGMSLQTPRVLTDGDVARLRAAVGGKAVPAKPARPAKPVAPARAAMPATLLAAAKPSAKPAAAAAAGTLDAIAAAITAGDTHAALDAALAAWRATRAPALADLIDAIDARIASPALTTDAAWTVAARSKSSAQLGALLAALPALPAGFLPMAGQTLSELPDDPRLARAIMELAKDPPTTSSSTYKFWSATLDAIARGGDVRARPLIARRLARPMAKSDSAIVGHKLGGVSQFWPKFYGGLERVAKKLAAVPIAAVDDKAIAALAKRAAKLPVVGLGASAPTATAAPVRHGAPLEEAHAHLAAGRVGPAIEALLVAWRAHKLPALADLIDRASRLLPSAAAALPVTPKAQHEAWLARFAEDAQANLPLLLPAFYTRAVSMNERRLLDLATLPDDPRVARTLAETIPFYGISNERGPYWKALFTQIARIGDVRVAFALRQEFGDFTRTWCAQRAQAQRILGDFALHPPAIAPPDAAAAKQLARLATALTALEAARDPAEATLLAAIADDWASDAPRLVYADWLMEREHPRGEAISLACKKAAAGGKLPAPEEQRRRQVFASYGALDDVECEHERGLPVSFEMGASSSTLTLSRIAAEPLLRFITTITCDDGDQMPAAAADVAAVMTSPHAGKLAKVTYAADAESQDTTDALAAIVGPAWKRVGAVFTRRV